MAASNDFIVDWQGSQEATVKKIIQRLFLNDIEEGMPLLVVATGRSGTGKSYTTIKAQDWIYESKNIDYADYLKKNVVLSPIDYGKQIKAILQDKEYKRIFTIQIDEGRFVVGAENWGTFVNAAIGHVNASARSIKPMITFIVTQSLRDIDKKLRDAINIQMILKKDNGQPYVSFRKFWIDDTDVERPRLRYRIPTGTIKFEDGSKQRIKLKWKPTRIRPELSEQYEEMMRPIKNSIIDQKMNKLIEKMEKDLGENRLGRIETLAEHFVMNGKLRAMLGKISWSKNQWTPNADAQMTLGLSDEEMILFKKTFKQKMTEMRENGVVFGEESIEPIRQE